MIGFIPTAASMPRPLARAKIGRYYPLGTNRFGDERYVRVAPPSAALDSRDPVKARPNGTALGFSADTAAPPPYGFLPWLGQRR